MDKNNLHVHRIGVGDLRTSMGVTLEQDGGAVDLTGLTVKALGSKDDKTEWFAEDEDRVTVVDAAAGQVAVSFEAADVDTRGTYWLWLRVYAVDGVSYDTFPCDGRKLQVKISDAE